MFDLPLSLPYLASASGVVVLALVGIAAAFSALVLIRYVPIVVRLIGQAPLLVAESSEALEGGSPCAFQTADGRTLRGTYLPTTAAERRGVIVFGHELNGDRWNATPYVRELLPAGYDVLTFDFRNHGTSDADPKLMLRPWISPADAADMQAAVDFACARGAADHGGIGILGISRGAVAGLYTAANDPRVKCLFTDGAYPTTSTHQIYLHRYLEIYVPRHWHFLSRRLPDWVFHGVLALGTRWWCLTHRYKFLDVEKAARNIRVPVQMVHGQRDTMIPLAAAEALRQCIAGPVQLWVVPGAKHNQAVTVESVEYQRRLLDFFDAHLTTIRQPAAAATAGRA